MKDEPRTAPEDASRMTTPDNNREPRRIASALASGTRALVRQLAAAVYVWIAFAAASRALREAPVWTLTAAQVLLVFAGGAIFARVVAGPLAVTGLVGAWYGVLDLALGLLLEPPSEDIGRMLLGAGAKLLAPALAGFLGALLATRTRRRASGGPAAPEV